MTKRPRASRRPRRSPLTALAAAIARAAAEGPLAVAFSGGRDSSLLLAVATLVCRRGGGEDPVPITLGPPRALPEADERAWQERVLRHLQLSDWERVQADLDLDLVGSAARRHLLRDGPLFPANVHALVPLLRAADGRRVLVGIGGDELFNPQQWWSMHELLGRRRRPQPRDLIRLGGCAIPRRLRGLARRSPSAFLDELHWIRPDARALLDRRLRQRCEEPVWWSTAIRHVAVRRDVALQVQSLERLARAEGGRFGTPLIDRGFVDALARAGGVAGWGSRSRLMETLAGDLLPTDVLRRRGKATFNRAFFAGPSRAFAESWSGTGLDESIVDPEALRREWLSEVPDSRTAMLLQAAWLAEQPHSRRAAA